MATIFYRSHFRGWTPVTIEQARQLAHHIKDKALAVSEADMLAHIGSRFRGVTAAELLEVTP